jgi:hypothetical protein
MEIESAKRLRSRSGPNNTAICATPDAMQLNGVRMRIANINALGRRSPAIAT